MPDPAHFDMVVIGSGPAGESAAITAARLGKRVALVEKASVVGGAWINTGTVPSKTLRETALALSGLRSHERFGVDLSLRRQATIDEFLHHERAVKAAQQAEVRRLLDRYGVQIVHGTGRFEGSHTVRVSPPDGTHTDLHGDKIVIAIGSVPRRPSGFPFEHNRVHESDLLIDLHELPRSLAVLGAGVIGSEYACIFATLGTRTTLIDARDELLPFLDDDLSNALKTEMQKNGVQFRWGARVTACEVPPDEADIQLTFDSGEQMAVHHLLICAGRESRIEALNPGAAGIEPAAKGRLAVNEFYQTNVPHIYAAGDVVGFPALASTSADQGRAAALHACGEARSGVVAAVLPTGIYTIPEISAAGETESALRERGEDYLVGWCDYRQVPRGKIIGDSSGFLKLLFRRSDRKLLGVHVFGDQASEVVHVGVLALAVGAGADLFLDTCFNSPTLGELYKQAAHDAILKDRVND